MFTIGRRKSSIYLIGGLVFFFVFLSYRHLDRDPPSSARPRPQNGPSSGPDRPGGESQSKWTHYKPRYPVDPASMRPLPTGKPLALPRIQADFPPETEAARADREAKQRRIRDAMLKCWDAYRQHAWLHDELRPITGGRRDPFGGWGATLVDSLDTLWIMGLRDEFDDAVAALEKINFETTSLNEVSIFETTIRYLGGFLAAYDLSGDKRLLAKAVEVGDMIYAAFDTPNRMPVVRWDLKGAARGVKQEAGTHVLLAEIGTFALEFTRLSVLTGNPKWFDASERITDMLRAQQQTTRLPGMWPILGDAKAMKFNDHPDHSLGALADSWYEYLPKMYALSGGLLPVYRQMYEDAMDTAIRYNLFRPMTETNEDILVSGSVYARTRDGKFETILKPEGQHLACFVGGMLAVGGKLVQNQTHIDKGAKVTEGCIWSYKVSPLGIMPEVFYLLPCESTSGCEWDEKKWRDTALEKANFGGEMMKEDEFESLIKQKRFPRGFTSIPDSRYHLRPEAIESVFILYRVTGRKDLLEAAWDMYLAIDKHTRTELAYSALIDMTVTDGKAPMSDVMESFWMGETLKYFYLMFSEPDLISLDEWVFNTEAHPLKRVLP
ncbi:glycoside hydrolase [Echria macrotheca]|uniref:alpha-1,2-Mannosidase n=1 Tax=Echria macrotheca TaxID=438768 RepID=A0AAJ0BJJ8_9PEZI|nr:glycoside hydrolase [Echria macrotheca]